jgi:uncharacterized protein YjiS (DUF1127 family)
MSIFFVTTANRATFGRSPDALKLAGRALLWAVSGPLRLVNFWRTRRELSALAAMSGYELRDIGLTPFDVANAMASSSAGDATQGLAQLAQNRRFKRES